MLTKAAREAKEKAKEELENQGFFLANRIEKYNVKAKDPNSLVFDALCGTSRALYNCINWRCRKAWKEGQPLLGFVDFDTLCKSGEDPHLLYHYRSLPAQVAQQVINACMTDWSNYWKSLKAYKEDPSKFLELPKPPGYKHRRFQIIIPQAFTTKNGFLSFLKTRGIKRIKLWGKYPRDSIKQIQINPQATTYQIVVTYEIKIKKEPTNDLEDKFRRLLGVDIGVNNFITCANNVGLTPFIISGRTIKSLNQFYNKAVANAKSQLPYFATKNGRRIRKTSKKIKILGEKRHRIIEDLMHKISKFLVDYCLHHQLDTLVIGYNEGWKQEVNLGSKTNQNFVYIPFRRFIDILSYKCLDAKIILKEVTEEYTSKCSFLDNEPLCHHDKYLGRRVRRGLFKSAEGHIINADINGALNIIRKVFPNAFDNFEGKWDRGCGLHPVKLTRIFRLTGSPKIVESVSHVTLTKMEIKDSNKLKLLKIVNTYE